LSSGPRSPHGDIDADAGKSFAGLRPFDSRSESTTLAFCKNNATPPQDAVAIEAKTNRLARELWVYNNHDEFGKLLADAAK